MTDTDPYRLAEDLERQAENLERHGDKVQGEIDQTRAEWARKRKDPNVPGAAPEPVDAAAKHPSEAPDEDAR